MPPLQQQTQKEKRQGRRMNPYRRQRLNLAGSATTATFEFVGSQFEWAQAQQLHSSTVENEWQNMTSSENGDSTNDYDDNEQSSLKQQVNETNELVLMVSLENPSRKQLDRNTKRGATILELEQNDAIIQPLEQSEPVPVKVPELLQCISIVANDNGNDNETDSSLQQDDGSTILTGHTSSGRSRSRSRSQKSQTRVRRRRRAKGRGDARGHDQIQTEEDVDEHPVDEAGNESKRRKIAIDNDNDNTIANHNDNTIANHNDNTIANHNDNNIANHNDNTIANHNDNTIANHAMNIDGNEEVVLMEGINENNINLESHPNRTTAPRGRIRTNRGKIRGRKDLIKSPPSRKPRGKRGRPNVIPGTTRTDDVRGSDQDEQHESMSDVSQSLVATIPDVPEPEPRSTLVLRKFLESLCASDLVLSRDRLLRLGTYMLDYFVSQAWCRPFVNPEDESAVYYRLIITRLMDLTTVEHNLWAGVYDGSVSRFYEDLAQIMYNAFKFHPEGTIIFNEANSMLACFVDLTTKFSKPPHDLSKLDDNLALAVAKLPHEEFSDVCGVSPNIESRLYIVPLYSFRQVSRSGSNVAKLPQAAAERLDPMSRPLFDVFDRRHLPPVRFQPTEMHCNFGRLYITMGAQNIKNCRDEQNAILIIVKDVSYMRVENRLRCNAIVSKPFGELRELDTIGFPELQDARYWTRVAFLDRVSLDIKVGPKFFDKYLRTPFKVSEYDKGIITPQQHDAFLAALNLRQDNSLEGLTIWQRLVAEANRVKVPIESIESLGKPIQVDAEGFFKRVFHVPGDDKYVVQNFKEISEGTLETRIKEAVCCLKTKGVSNTGQIRSVYKDDEDDELVGLSMERYSYTLKEYAFNTRSPITGEQKYRLIHDMVKGIKALHDAGFAHRDLSEVNMMVNNTNERLGDGSTKPELVVIDFGKAEFINRDDVLTWSVGEVSNEKLEHLPWIKTVPDHGYKLYRSAATLPRTKNDHAVLQYPIDPCSEDIYAVGVLAWRIFSGQAPWGGILDTDLKNLREIVTDPIKIRFHIEKNVNGKKSREMLLKCITSTPQERSTARELLDWIIQAKDELISEWATSGRMRIRKQF